MAECPTCNGSGKVPKHVADALMSEDIIEDGVLTMSGTCHCDGPPHTYSPGWCPRSGPVVR